MTQQEAMDRGWSARQWAGNAAADKMATEGEKVEKEKVLPKDAQVRLHI